MTYLNKLKEANNKTLTENGENTLKSSLDANLDFFALSGSARSLVKDYLQDIFMKAYREDPVMAMKNLFYLRDIHEGLGERDSFRILYDTLVDIDSTIVSSEDILIEIPEYGRWDDLVSIYDHILCVMEEKSDTQSDRDIKDTIVSILYEELFENEDPTLLAKWIPSQTSHNKRKRYLANRLADDMGVSRVKYRKHVSKKRKELNLVETHLSERTLDEVEFEKLPSLALFKYADAFRDRVPEQYNAFIEKAMNGGKLNAKHMLPHKLAGEYIDGKDYDKTIEATWKNLKDTIDSSDESAIVVSDVSGSMYGLPMTVSVGLGLYAAERLEGVFADHVITFSEEPSLLKVDRTASLYERVQTALNANWGFNTDLEKVFKLLLNTAVENNSPQSDMPSKLIIVSDMEFDQADGSVDKTFYQKMEDLYSEEGYVLPDVVFWNVDARSVQIPVSKHESGTALVSGFSTNVFKYILRGELPTPLEMMEDVLGQERYEHIGVLSSMALEDNPTPSVNSKDEDQIDHPLLEFTGTPTYQEILSRLDITIDLSQESDNKTYAEVSKKLIEMLQKKHN